MVYASRSIDLHPWKFKNLYKAEESKIFTPIGRIQACNNLSSVLNVFNRMFAVGPFTKFTCVGYRRKHTFVDSEKELGYNKFKC